MKTKEDRDFERLFQDANLQPSRRFDRQLRRQLGLRGPQSRSVIWRMLSAATAVAILSLVVIATFQPDGSQKPGDSSIIARTLYAQAVAAQSPQDLGQHTTFWRIDRQTTLGPQADSCTGLSAGGPAQAAKNRQLTTTAIYNDGKTSALVQSSNGTVNFQRYSGDGAVSAADIKNFESSNDLPGLQNNVILTDKTGNALPKDAKVDNTEPGHYDLYLKVTNAPNDTKIMPNCTTLIIHATIDTATKVATEIETFKDSIAPQNLAQRTTQKISTRQASYEQALPELAALGFDQRAANLAKDHSDYVQETSNAGGYIFSYVKSIYGMAHVQTVSDDAGHITAYRYTFSAQPNVIMIVRTANAPADGYPTTVDQLQSLSTANKWQITKSGPSTTQFPTLDPVTTNDAQATGDGKVRILMEFSAPSNIRSVYIEQNEDTVPLIPRPQGMPRMVQYTPPKNLIGPFVPFKVGESVPSMR